MRRRLPSMNALIAFEAAARRENFSRAADDLSLTQGAISQQIRTLETFLGGQLFERANGRLRANERGQRLLGELSPMLDAIETSMAGVRKRSGETAPVMVVTYPALASRWLLTRLLTYNATLANAVSGSAEVRMDTIVSNVHLDPTRFDLAIVQGEPPFAGMKHWPLMPERLVIAGKPGLAKAAHKGGIEALIGAAFLRHATRPTSLWLWSSSAGRPIPDPTIGPKFDRYEMLIEAAIAGYGLAVFPEVLIARELQAQQLALAHPHVATPKAAYHILADKGRPLSEAAAAFRTWIQRTPLVTPTAR